MMQTKKVIDFINLINKKYKDKYDIYFEGNGDQTVSLVIQEKEVTILERSDK